MQIAVISDLHLGRGDKSDLFGHDDAEFLRFLDYLEGNFERIVLLGDIYETLTCTLPFQQRQEIARVQAAHPEIAKRFTTAPYTYIHGNHDIVASSALNAPSEMTLDVDGHRILFTHGHWYDVLSKPSRVLQEWGVWLGGWLLRVGLEKVHQFFERLDDMMRGARLNPGACRFQRWAVAMASARNADIVVTGHTHMGVTAEHGDGLFLNSGSCSKGAFSFLSLDTAAGSYAVNGSW